LTTAGPFGSLLTIVSVADADPRSVGWNRIGTATESPPSTVRGKLITSGVTKIGADEAMPVTLSWHGPRLLMTRSRSTNVPRRTSPKSPESAMIRLALASGTTPETATTWGLAGSLLKIVIAPERVPWVDGWKRMTTSIESPESMSSG
jgi:hypothetical protein